MVLAVAHRLGAIHARLRRRAVVAAAARARCGGRRRRAGVCGGGAARRRGRSGGAARRAAAREWCADRDHGADGADATKPDRRVGHRGRGAGLPDRCAGPTGGRLRRPGSAARRPAAGRRGQRRTGSVRAVSGVPGDHGVHVRDDRGAVGAERGDVGPGRGRAVEPGVAVAVARRAVGGDLGGDGPDRAGRRRGDGRHPRPRHCTTARCSVGSWALPRTSCPRRSR